MLHIRYTRGINATCSIVQDAAGCWAQVGREARLVRALASLPPPVQACTDAYAAAEVGAEDPSLLSYSVEMTLDAAGKATTLARGTVGCAPMP